MDVSERMVRAFPSSIAREAEAAAASVAAMGATLSPDAFMVAVGTEHVAIPERLYVQECDALAGGDSVAACLFTRHHDGHVRQHALETVLRLDTPWAAPFVVRLAGEYVIEIVEQIDEGLAQRPFDHLQAFVVANPDFVRLTRARVTSYWNCYYRHVPRRDYAGFRLMDRIEAAAGP